MILGPAFRRAVLLHHVPRLNHACHKVVLLHESPRWKRFCPRKQSAGVTVVTQSRPLRPWPHIPEGIQKEDYETQISKFETSLKATFSAPLKESLVGSVCMPGSPKHSVCRAGLKGGQHHRPLEGPHPHSPGAAQDLDGVRRVVAHEVEGRVRLGQPLVDRSHLTWVNTRVQIS